MKKKGFQSNIFIGLIGVLASLVISEIIARIVDLKPKPIAALPTSMFEISNNPVLRYEYRKNFRSNHPAEFNHINELGFRDKVYPKAKPQNTTRIIVLGDSTTAGTGVESFHDTYPKILESKLNRSNSGVKYEVLNMAVGGYHTYQEVELFEKIGLQYNPDLVIITICLNDFHISSDGNVYSRLLKENKGHVPGLEPEAYRWFLSKSRLAFALHHRIKSKLVKDEVLIGQHKDEWYSKNILKGQNPVNAGLERLYRLSKKHQFKVTVVVLPWFYGNFQDYGFHYMHQKVRDAVNKLDGIEYWDVKEDFQKVSQKSDKFSIGDNVHMNAFGHSVLSQILFEKLKK